MIDDKAKTISTTATPALMINEEELAMLGLNAIAYVRDGVEPMGPDDATAPPRRGFSIHAANGQRIGWAPSLDLAQIAVRQHDMVPMTVH